MNFSSKYLSDKNWKIYKKIIIVNGVSFELKDLAKLPLNDRLDFHPLLFITLNIMIDKSKSGIAKKEILKNVRNQF